MNNKKYKPQLLILSLLLISVIGFKDYGVMIKPFVSKDNVKFDDKEIVYIVNEDKNGYNVEKEGKLTSVNKDSLLLTLKNSNIYKVRTLTGIASANGAAPFDYLKPGEELELLHMENGGYIFVDSNKRIGFVDVKDLDNVSTKNVTQAYSTVNKTLKNGDNTLIMKKNEKVSVIDYDGLSFTLSDGKNTYKAHKNDISLVEVKEEKQQIDRSSYVGRADVRGLIEFAKAQLGKAYVYGTAGPSSFDCSGLVYYCYKSVLGITVPRSSAALVSAGVAVDKTNLLPGDILLFNTSGSGISHAGLYIGDGKMIHASSGSVMSVVVSDVYTGYYANRFVAARRVLK